MSFDGVDLYFSYAGLRGSPTHDRWAFLFLTEVRLAWQLQNLERTLFMSCLGLWQRVGMGRGARAGEQPQRFLHCHRPRGVKPRNAEQVACGDSFSLSYGGLAPALLGEAFSVGLPGPPRAGREPESCAADPAGLHFSIKSFATLAQVRFLMSLWAGPASDSPLRFQSLAQGTRKKRFPG